jgi:hypothetical protein
MTDELIDKFRGMNISECARISKVKFIFMSQWRRFSQRSNISIHHPVIKKSMNFPDLNRINLYFSNSEKKTSK